MENEFKSLYTMKATNLDNIPSKHLKHTFDICSPTLNKMWCEAVLNCSFPSKLKLADITAIYKNDDATCVMDYRSVSVLSVVSKLC